MKLALAFLALTSPALAGDFNQFAATGIARIISQSELCGIVVDQAGMDAHLEQEGLSSAEALGFISNKVYLDQNVGDPATDAECTAIRSTAKAIGVTR